MQQISCRPFPKCNHFFLWPSPYQNFMKIRSFTLIKNVRKQLSLRITSQTDRKTDEGTQNITPGHTMLESENTALRTLIFRAGIHQKISHLNITQVLNIKFDLKLKPITKKVQPT